jgi:hypothetical protein
MSDIWMFQKPLRDERTTYWVDRRMKAAERAEKQRLAGAEWSASLTW